MGESLLPYLATISGLGVSVGCRQMAFGLGIPRNISLLWGIPLFGTRVGYSVLGGRDPYWEICSLYYRDIYFKFQTVNSLALLEYLS